MADIEAKTRARYASYMRDYQSQAADINRQMDKVRGVKGARAPAGGSFVPGSLKVN